MIAGAVVHKVSLICPSKINHLVCLVWMMMGSKPAQNM